VELIAGISYGNPPREGTRSWTHWISGDLEEYEDPTDLVAAGYDRVSEAYTEQALWGSEARRRYTQIVLDRMPEGSDVLDLGCGAGVPTTALLAERFSVTGLELSGVQIAHVREAVPEA
jgi:cyclopropane fatty-acyl-phospholipid synthase-like methyltransferase